MVEKNGSVTFSGIVPGGLNTNRGYLFSLIVTAKKEGDAKIDIKSQNIFLNDGNGTLAKTKVSPLPLSIVSEKVGKEFYLPIDNSERYKVNFHTFKGVTTEIRKYWKKKLKSK